MILKRKIFEKLRKQEKDRKISLLIGARQVGKTTLLKELFSQLSRENKCIFFDLDLISDYEKVSSFESLLNLIKLKGYNENQKEFFYLFLDEFQKYPSLVKVMKNVYDNLPNVKLYASGSSSLIIKNQVQESLAGRKIINELFPLDFEEFLIFRKEENLAKNLKNIRKLNGDKLSGALKEYRRLLEEFMIFGGYPEVVLKDTKDENLQKGLGGTFSFFELGKAIEMESLLEGKNLPSYMELARYVFYTATGEEFDEKEMDEKKNFIGESKNYQVFLCIKA